MLLIKYRYLVAICFFVILPYVLIAQNSSDIYVNGYFRKDGTYVSGHYRSAPNNSFYDNYSTKGNINPYTLREGWKTKEDVSISYSSYFQKKVNFSRLERAIKKNDKVLFDFLLREIKNEDDKSFLSGLFYFSNNKYELALSQFIRLKAISNNTYYVAEANSMINVLNGILDKIAWNEFKEQGLDTIKYQKRYSKTEYNNIVDRLLKKDNERNYFIQYKSLFLLQATNGYYQEARTSLNIVNNYLPNGDFFSLEDFDYIIPLMKAYDDAKASNTLELTLKEFINAHTYLLREHSKINNNDVLVKNHFDLVSSKDNLSTYSRNLYDFETGKGIPAVSVYQVINDFFNDSFLILTSIKFESEAEFLNFKNTLTTTASLIEEGSKVFKKSDLYDVRREYYLKEFPNVGFAENTLNDNKSFILYSIIHKGFTKQKQIYSEGEN